MTPRILQRPTLVLNRNWQPVNVATVARALVLLWNESARAVDPANYQLYTWADWSKLRPRNGDILDLTAELVAIESGSYDAQNVARVGEGGHAAGQG